MVSSDKTYMMGTWRGSISLVFSLACISGLLYQLFVVCSQYHEYRTTTKIQPQYRNQTIPDIAICFRFEDLLDKDRLKTDIDQLSVSDIFDFTPGINETLKSCGKRRHNSYRWQDLTENECYQVFYTRKFLFAEYICYTFEPELITNDIKLERNTLARHHRRVIYRLVMGHQLEKAKSLMPIAFGSIHHRDFPWFSRHFGRQFNRFSPAAQLIWNHFYILTEETSAYLQPPPYDTMCNNNQAFKKTIPICQLENYKILGRVPYTDLIYERSNLRPFNSQDMENDTTDAIIEKIEDYCTQEGGRHNLCDGTFFVTNVITDLIETEERSITIDIMSIESPITIIEFLPAFPLLDLVIYVSTCFGFWFGLSVYSLNPAKWKIFHGNLTNSVSPIEKYKAQANTMMGRTW